jgi:spectinomycin phosphotransferase
MKIKGVHEKEVKEFIERNYLLKIKKIKYHPIGEDGCSYILNSKRKKYFVKVFNKGEKAFKSVREVKVTLDFLFKIRKDYGFENAPLPLINKNGNLISKNNGFSMVVYDYIQGKNLSKISRKDYKELGIILAKLHNIRPKDFPKIKCEKLDLKAEKIIFDKIAEVRKRNFKKGSSGDRLKKILISGEEGIIKGFDFLKKNVGYIRKNRKSYAITHTDLHGFNMMKGKGDIYLIDWDSLEFALPEKDLRWFREDRTLEENFAEEYSKTLDKKFRLDKLAFKYYEIRRRLAILGFFSNILLSRELEKGEIKNYIRPIEKGTKKIMKILKKWPE